MAMGPFAAQDLAGIDIAMSGHSAFPNSNKPGVRQPQVAEKLYAAGHYGQKTGAGWYLYDEKRTPRPNPEVHDLIGATAREGGIAQRQISSSEIVERTIYAAINEGARILEEGFALRASDVDMVYIHGYGFPAYRGGPMHYADALGLKALYERILEFQGIHGDPWEPAPLLKRLAERNESFAAWDAQRGH